MSFYVIILLWGICYTPTVTQSSVLQQNNGLVSVFVGGNVTFHCFYQGDIEMHSSWYQQMLGRKPQLISTTYKYDDAAKMFNQFRNNSRFSVQCDKESTHLNIFDVQLSDSATYYCGHVRANAVRFGEGVFLRVKESSFKAMARQPVSESVEPGDSVNCTVHTETCDGDHRLHWFRPGCHLGLIRTRDDQCEDVSERGSPAQSCVYHPQTRNASLSDAGTYSCAVASCGEILFGNKRLDMEDDVFEAHIGTLVLLSIVRTGILLFVLFICALFYIVKKKCCLFYICFTL